MVKKLIYAFLALAAVMLAGKSYKALQEWHIVEAQVYARANGPMSEAECRKGPAELKSVLRCAPWHLPPDHYAYISKEDALRSVTR